MLTATVDDDARPVLRLRADIFTARMRARGYRTVTAQAAAVGCSRQALYDLMNGDTGPRPQLARRMASVSDTDLPDLFEVVAS